MKNILTEALVNSATNASFIFQLYKFCKVKVISANHKTEKVLKGANGEIKKVLVGANEVDKKVLKSVNRDESVL